ncbi:MAG: hypothetical protein WKF73_01395 [Nocardioidaceae bacterium]
MVTAISTIGVLGRRRRAARGPRAGKARLAERFAAGEIDEDGVRRPTCSPRVAAEPSTSPEPRRCVRDLREGQASRTGVPC